MVVDEERAIARVDARRRLKVWRRHGVGLGGRRAELLKVGYSNGALDLGVKRGARGIVLLLADDEAKLAPIARRAGFAVDGAGAFG